MEAVMAGLVVAKVIPPELVTATVPYALVFLFVLPLLAVLPFFRQRRIVGSGLWIFPTIAVLAWGVFVRHDDSGGRGLALAVSGVSTTGFRVDLTIDAPKPGWFTECDQPVNVRVAFLSQGRAPKDRPRLPPPGARWTLAVGGRLANPPPTYSYDFERLATTETGPPPNPIPTVLPGPLRDLLAREIEDHYTLVRGRWPTLDSGKADSMLSVAFAAKWMRRRSFGTCVIRFPSVLGGPDHLAVGADVAAQHALHLDLAGPLATTGDVGLFTHASVDRSRLFPPPTGEPHLIDFFGFRQSDLIYWDCAQPTSRASESPTASGLEDCDVSVEIAAWWRAPFEAIALLAIGALFSLWVTLRALPPPSTTSSPT